jgi:hypothetical protein
LIHENEKEHTTPGFGRYLCIWNRPVSINSAGTSHDASAMLDVTSTTKGMLVPRMTTAQRDAMDANIQFSYTGTSTVLKIDANRDGTFEYNFPATVSNTTPGLCGLMGFEPCYFDSWCYGTTCQ